MMQLTEQLAKDYQYFFNCARALIHNEDAARDIVQEAFLKAQKTRAQPRGNYKTWMCRIILTTIADEYRRRNRHQTLPLIIDFPAQDNPVEETKGRELDEKIAAILRRNKSPVISTLLDRALLDRSYAQLSADYEIPVRTVSSRLHAARLQLKKELAEFL